MGNSIDDNVPPSTLSKGKDDELTTSENKETSAEILKPDDSPLPEVPTFLVEGCPPTDTEESQSQEVNGRNYEEELPQGASSLFSLTSLSRSETGGLNVPSTLRLQKGFSIISLRDYMADCLKDNEIYIDSYLNAYSEICKLLDSLGSIFRNLVSRDLKNKVSFMRLQMAGEHGPCYETIGKMVEFEKSSGLYLEKPHENGSRTVLALHRSLNFVAEFLKSLNTLRPNQSVGSVGKDAYYRTLEPFHPMSYRSFAVFAFLGLGKKAPLLANFHDGSMTYAQLHETIEAVVNLATRIYTQCQAIYEQNDFLDLQ